MQDLTYIFQWWLLFFGIGIVFFPITFFLFKNFFDYGYIFSKTLGVVIVSYSIFLLATLKILRLSTINIYFVVWIFIVLNLFIIFKNYRSLLSAIRQSFKIIVFEELLFFLTLAFWSYVRGHEPSIHGLEKFMDFGFINSILRSEYLPAPDMWFAGHGINYYYFGHFITAVLTKLSLIPSFITYNLMLATIFALTFTSSFSIGANLIYALRKRGATQVEGKGAAGPRAVITGIISAILVTLAGNHHTIYSFFVAYKPETPVPPWLLKFSFFTIENGNIVIQFPNNYWYANATRFIPFTIHEFPMYSFVVADLHGHVLDIPVVLLTIALLFSILRKQTLRFELCVLSLLLAVMYMTNAWDGIIYFLLAALVFFFTQWRKIKYFFAYLFVIGIGFVIFSLPFSLKFKPFVSGIGVVCAPDFLVKLQKLGPFLFEANHCQRSEWWQLLILYGFFYFWIIGFIVFIFKKTKISQLAKSDIFVLLLILLSTFLIIFPEFFYAKDIYPAHYRANTMFKLVYQSFIMLSIVSAYSIIKIFSHLKEHRAKTIFQFSRRGVFYLISFSFFVLILMFPYFSTQSYYQFPPKLGMPPCLSMPCIWNYYTNQIQGDIANYKGLDGTAYLKTLYPSDYEAIKWINTHIKGQPIIAESQGDSYTDYGRISINTGLPTVLGWTVHEWLWRGSYDIPAPRVEEVKNLYETQDDTLAKSILKKYNVVYVYVGKLEREKYPLLNEEKFNNLGKVVFKHTDAKIYKINNL